MKDLKTIASNYQAPTEQKEPVVIDEFAKSIIDRVFNSLAIIFPAWKHNWKSDDPNDPDKVLREAKREWTKAFIENNICTMDQIKYGFAKARQSESDFLPSCGKFISWCEPTAEDMGYPSEQQSMRLCVAYRNSIKLGLASNARPLIIELYKRLDWFLLNSAGSQAEHKKAEKHFHDEYMKLIKSDYREPQETTHERLESEEVVKDRMSPQQIEDGKKRGLECLSDIKKKLKSKS